MTEELRTDFLGRYEFELPVGALFENYTGTGDVVVVGICPNSEEAYYEVWEPFQDGKVIESHDRVPCDYGLALRRVPGYWDRVAASDRIAASREATYV